MTDRVSPKVRSKIMSRIRYKDTVAEMMLRKSLYSKGIRYRLNVKSLPGKPDIVFFKDKIAIFVDGDFWHGKDWNKLQLRLSNGYWLKKISGNIKRDRLVTLKLEKGGWMVFRFWESDIKKNVENITSQLIENMVSNFQTIFVLS